MEELVERRGVTATFDVNIESTPSIDKLAAALSKFQGECRVIVKDKKNLFLKSMYADLGSILQVINPLLGANGLAVVQMPVGDAGDLVTMITHTSGQWIRSRYRMRPSKNDPQSIGSSITYQKRYALVAMLNLPVDDDDDGEAGSQAQQTPVSKLRDKLGTVMRSYTKQGWTEALSKAGINSADLKKRENDEEFLRKAYEVLGGDERLAAVTQ